MRVRSCGTLAARGRAVKTGANGLIPIAKVENLSSDTGGLVCWALLAEPVLDNQPRHAAKLILVGGDQGQPLSQGMGSDEQVVAADWRARAHEYLSDLTVAPIGMLVEREDLQGRQHGFQLGGQSLGALPNRAKTQFRGDDDAGADLVFAARGDAIADASRGSTHKIRDGVRVEQIRGLRHGKGPLEIDWFRHRVVDVWESFVNGL